MRDEGVGMGVRGTLGLYEGGATSTAHEGLPSVSFHSPT